MANLTYNPDIFKVSDAEAARRIILTPEGGRTTDQRWELETPYLAQLLQEKLQLSQGQLVVDFGCGLGRMARELIQRCECRVLGVDISEEMRGLAPGYVKSRAFSVVSNRIFEGLVEHGLRVDAAISIWVLQHCLDPKGDLALLAQSLKAGGRFGLVNNIHRAVPTREKTWASDGLDVRALAGETLVRQDEGALDPEKVGALLAEHTFWGVYAKGSAGPA